MHEEQAIDREEKEQRVNNADKGSRSYRGKKKRRHKSRKHHVRSVPSSPVGCEGYISQLYGALFSMDFYEADLYLPNKNSYSPS